MKQHKGRSCERENCVHLQPMCNPQDRRDSAGAEWQTLMSCHIHPMLENTMNSWAKPSWTPLILQRRTRLQCAAVVETGDISG